MPSHHVKEQSLGNLDRVAPSSGRKRRQQGLVSVRRAQAHATELNPLGGLRTVHHGIQSSSQTETI